MTEEQVEKICSNCGKSILIQQFDLHEVYCCRNIIKCPQCSEPIEKCYLDEHIKDQHSKHPCKFCCKEFQASEMEEHEQNCERKPQICKFCSMPISYDDYYNHVYQCGARTEKCQVCQKNVLLRDLEEHELYCQIKEYNNQKIKLSDNSVEEADSFE